ncbi:MAG: hypothetical protein KIS67_10730 [Verrucomicrobiae bacterium]|nr:hypothetical protein [Verrucomicrobiae bacterium]
MKTTQIHRLEKEIEVLRQELGVSARGEMIFQSPRSMWSEKDVIVEADGDGGAKLLIVEGNYPADYMTHKEQYFQTEDEACEAAERLIAPAYLHG